MTWPGLPHMREVDARHRDVLVELHTLHQAALRGRRAHAYGDKDLDLTVIDSPRLWALLDEATGAGVELLYQRKGLGALPRPGAAQLCRHRRDPRRPRAHPHRRHRRRRDARRRARVLRHGRARRAVPAPRRPTPGLARGVAVPDRPADRHRAAGDAGPGDRQHLRHGAGRGRGPVRVRLLPAAHAAAAIRSVDDAFTPPTVDGPHLLLTVSYLSGHRAQLHWEFRYTVGEAEQTVELYQAMIASICCTFSGSSGIPFASSPPTLL